MIGFNKKIIFSLLFVLLISQASAFSVSPTTLDFDKENLSFDLYAINTSSEAISLEVKVRGFKTTDYILSKTSVDVGPNSNNSVNLTFLENVFGQGQVCLVQGGEGQVGQAVEVCVGSSVATTDDGLPTDEEPILTEKIVDQIIILKRTSLTAAQQQVLSAQNRCVQISVYEEANSILLQAAEKISEAEKAKVRGNLFEANELIQEADNLITKALAILPSIITVTEDTLNYPFSQDEIEKAFIESGITDQAIIDDAVATMKKLDVSRHVTLLKLLDKKTSQATFETKVTNIIRNLTNESLSSLKLVDSIPRSIANRSSEIRSQENFRIIRDTPIIVEWPFSLEKKETESIFYCIDREVPGDKFQNFITPLVLTRTIPALDSVSCVANSDCDDGNVCTTDVCSSAQCISSNVPDGTPCGNGLVCIQGTCGGEAPIIVTPEGEEFDFFLIIFILLLIIIILLIVFLLKKKKDDDEKPKPVQAPQQPIAQQPTAQTTAQPAAEQPAQTQQINK